MDCLQWTSLIIGSKKLPRGPRRTLRSKLLLQMLMDKRGLACNVLGPQIGTSRQTMANLTSGRRGGCLNEIAEKLAAALEVPIDDLFWPMDSDGPPKLKRSQR